MEYKLKVKAIKFIHYMNYLINFSQNKQIENNYRSL